MIYKQTKTYKKQKFTIKENVKIVAAQKMPDRHFYLLRHHILFYITFLDFCLLAPDEIRILCGKNKGFLQKKCVNPLGFNFQRIHNLLGNPHSRQLQIQNSQKKEKNNTSQMRLGSVFKMRTSILNTATTEQMGCIIFFFFRLY